MDVLEPLFRELDTRDIGVSPAEKLRGAKQGLWLPLRSVRTGPYPHLPAAGKTAWAPVSFR
jgi:hypothetical protein